MTSSLRTLATLPPSGRSRALLVDSDAYTVAVVRQGAPLPWTDLAALGAHVGQVHSLLRPDAVWLDVDALCTAHLADRPDLAVAMGARPRVGYPLRTLLGDGDGVDRVVRTVRALADGTRRPVVLDLPSPARWLVRAHVLAGTPLDAVDADRADTASLYMAEWLGKLAGLPVTLVLLDTRPAPDGAAAEGPPEKLADYSAIANVVAHLGWGLALRAPDTVEVPAGEPTVRLTPDTFWTDPPTMSVRAEQAPAEGLAPAGGSGDGDVLLATIPATASPESVLAQLASFT